MLDPRQQLRQLINTVRFALANPSRLPVLAGKVIKRLRGEAVQRSPENDAWIAASSVAAEKLATSWDAALWDEAGRFAVEQLRHAEPILKNVPFKLGGGSQHRFLYWLTRYKRPKTVVETGVAAGWSSRAFLAALEKNRRGKLYSSDLPYFRIPDPERFVGILVEQGLRRRWSLEIEGDQVNLPRILAEVSSVDLFHYDSDKTESGREFGVKLVREKLSSDGIIMMDDIADDSWFRNYVTSNSLPHLVIDGRFGLIGSL